MRWSYYIGSLFGFPIRVHISLLIFLGIVLFTGGGIYGLVVMITVFASVILHELGHALVARSRGMKIVDISLYPLRPRPPATRS
jgi:Zn-dependent protease